MMTGRRSEGRDAAEARDRRTTSQTQWTRWHGPASLDPTTALVVWALQPCLGQVQVLVQARTPTLGRQLWRALEVPVVRRVALVTALVPLLLL